MIQQATLRQGDGSEYFLDIDTNMGWSATSGDRIVLNAGAVQRNTIKEEGYTKVTVTNIDFRKVEFASIKIVLSAVTTAIYARNSITIGLKQGSTVMQIASMGAGVGSNTPYNTNGRYSGFNILKYDGQFHLSEHQISTGGNSMYVGGSKTDKINLSSFNSLDPIRLYISMSAHQPDSGSSSQTILELNEIQVTGDAVQPPIDPHIPPLPDVDIPTFPDVDVIPPPMDNGPPTSGGGSNGGTDVIKSGLGIVAIALGAYMLSRRRK